MDVKAWNNLRIHVRYRPKNVRTACVTGWGKNETCDPFDIHSLITLPIHERCPIPPGCMSLSPTGNRTRAFRLYVTFLTICRTRTFPGISAFLFLQYSGFSWQYSWLYIKGLDITSSANNNPKRITTIVIWTKLGERDRIMSIVR